MNFLKQLVGRRSPVAESAVALAEPEAVLIATKVDLKLGDLELETEYNRVAEKLGVVKRPRSDWRRLAHALDELMIPVYDFHKVTEFLEKKAAEVAKQEAKAAVNGSAAWGWFPLNTGPVQPSSASFSAIEEYNRALRSMGLPPERQPNGSFRSSTYNKRVPLPVLLTAEKIEDKLPGEVSFFVSDIERYPDPFLGVCLKSDPEKRMFVVERWDEPGFRG